MLDAYYCTTAGVVQGTSHLPHPVHASSIAGHAGGASSSRIVEGEKSTTPMVSRARALISLCHEINLAPARGTRTHTRTTRRRVNTKTSRRQRSGDTGAGRDIALLLFLMVSLWARRIGPALRLPHSSQSVGHLAALDRHQASPCKLGTPFCRDVVARSNRQTFPHVVTAVNYHAPYRHLII